MRRAYFASTRLLSATLVLVTPTGHQVRGLDLASATALLKALS